MNETIPAFSNDPEENLSMENAFLKMKIAAQFGGDFGTMEGLPPGIENQFLKNVLQFETNTANKPTLAKKLREMIGNPSFTSSPEIPDEALTAALETVNNYYKKHGHQVDFLAEYPDRLKYEFLVEELLDHECEDSFMIDGMTSYHIYEEFHRNHAYAIEEQNRTFIEAWFRKDATVFEQLLATQIPLGTDELLDQSQVIKKIADMFDSFVSFENCVWVMDQLSYDLDEEEGLGMAFAEGGMKYDAVIESGELIHFEGPLKIYFALEGYYWNVIFFHIPGFVWKQ
ncbi:MAG: hypothetical protein ABIN94_18845 [Ferruginibacter sp.]